MYVVDRMYGGMIVSEHKQTFFYLHCIYPVGLWLQSIALANLYLNLIEIVLNTDLFPMTSYYGGYGGYGRRGYGGGYYGGCECPYIIQGSLDRSLLFYVVLTFIIL